MQPLNTRLMSRRTMLRTAGIAIGLPLLDAMLPCGLHADEKIDALAPQRMVLVGRLLGLHAPNFFPEKAGKDFESTRYLKKFDALRGDFTVFSGMSHVGYPSGHHTSTALFTGVSPEFIRSELDVKNSVSLDHFAAERVGRETRMPSLVLGSYHGMSWNPKGVANPAFNSQSAVFKRLFISGSPDEVARETRRLEDGKSILDLVRGQMKTLSNKLGATDRDRIDLFATSIREAEERLRQDQAWATKPKPKVDYKLTEVPLEQMVDRQRQWYDIVRLALQTDSTRVVLLVQDEGGNAMIPGLNMGHHDASHHGKDPQKLEQLAIVEEAEMQTLSDFLTSLKGISENGRTLLEKSMVLTASNLGNASAHQTSNLPVLLAGGGFKHQGHVAFDQKKNMELSNLYVRMLKKMGIESDKFGISTGVLSEVG